MARCTSQRPLPALMIHCTLWHSSRPKNCYGSPAQRTPEGIRIDASYGCQWWKHYDVDCVSFTLYPEHACVYQNWGYWNHCLWFFLHRRGRYARLACCSDGNDRLHCWPLVISLFRSHTPTSCRCFYCCLESTFPHL